MGISGRPPYCFDGLLRSEFPALGGYEDAGVRFDPFIDVAGKAVIHYSGRSTRLEGHADYPGRLMRCSTGTGDSGVRTLLGVHPFRNSSDGPQTRP